tara:strand:+ start:5002 stop:5997 length:996 start_codon:yes stop_codon:yes gene_type:complete
MDKEEIVKKKRGRKPKEKVAEKVLKKRGRKPNLNKPPDDKVPKKRGRKPKQIYVSDKENVISEEQIILHLPINSVTIDENIPKAFNQELEDNSMNHVFLNISDIDNSDNFESINKIDKLDKNYYDYMIKKLEKDRNNDLNMNISIENTNIFIEYSDSNSKNKWPKETNIDCLWCCHSFKNTPYGLPIKKQKECILMFGNFCCPECAAAYNFDNTNLNEDKWERYSLLNYLYSIEIPIKIAMSKLTLKRFGGIFSIEEWRNMVSEKNYKVNLPPIISVIPTLEEITYGNNNLFSGITNDMIDNTTNDLRLKRTKPLPNYKNTLESCMNLKYV